MPDSHDLVDQGLHAHHVRTSNCEAKGERCHQNTWGICCIHFHFHGNLLFWRLVPAIPRLLVRSLLPALQDLKKELISFSRAVPTPNVQCSAAIHHLITNAVFNISSDTLILAVALPMFIKTKLPLRKKVAIVGIFSLGSFVILCAILNKYYSFTDPFGSQWTNWYERESSTAILTANMPYMWALIRRVGHFRALDSISSNRYSYTFNQTNNNTRRSQVKSQIRPGRGPQSRATEMDDDLLMADTQSQKEGIHREIEIMVTEHDRDLSVNNEGSGVSVSSDSDWTERWAYNHKPSEGPKISSNGGSNGEMMELHALPKAVLKRQYSV